MIIIFSFYNLKKIILKEQLNLTENKFTIPLNQKWRLFIQGVNLNISV